MNMDVYLNKKRSIEVCLARIREKYDGREETLRNLDRQEIILLNLQRVCESAIDLAMHIVAGRNLGIPQDSRDAFRLMEKADLLGAELSERMQNMVGFRNIAIHPYQELNTRILQRILDEHLGDFEVFLDAVHEAG